MMQRLKDWVRENLTDQTCPHCGAFGDEDCEPTCVDRKCPECGGLGAVIDFEQPLGVSLEDGMLFGGKPCPRGCEAP